VQVAHNGSCVGAQMKMDWANANGSSALQFAFQMCE